MTGADLRAWRLAHGLTLEALAHEIGCGWATVRRWEMEGRVPHKFLLDRLLHVVRKIERRAARVQKRLDNAK